MDREDSEPTETPFLAAWGIHPTPAHRLILCKNLSLAVTKLKESIAKDTNPAITSFWDTKVAEITAALQSIDDQEKQGKVC